MTVTRGPEGGRRMAAEATKEVWTASELAREIGTTTHRLLRHMRRLGIRPSAAGGAFLIGVRDADRLRAHFRALAVPA